MARTERGSNAIKARRTSIRMSDTLSIFIYFLMLVLTGGGTPVSPWLGFGAAQTTSCDSVC